MQAVLKVFMWLMSCDRAVTSPMCPVSVCVCVCEWHSHVAHVASFCRPLQIPSYLPACFLFACLLFYHLLCHLFDPMHVVLTGVNVATRGLTPSQLSGCTVVTLCLRVTKLFGVISNKASRLLSSFPLIGFSFLLRPISVKMPGGEECGWAVVESWWSASRWRDCRTWFRHTTAPQWVVFFHTCFLIFQR